ncbi:MAG: hypothetical protein ACP5KN_07310, partial [Armatimonadota bacterium]
CWFRHDAERGFALRFRFGLSPAAGGELKSRAPFRFVIYRCDGRWGLRDAAQRYYALYPWAFESRAEREGLWIVRRGRTDEIPDPESYAFHEAVQSLDEAQWDDRHGIATCPYILPGQREITDLPELPESKREAWEVFQAWEPPDEIHTTMELRRLPGARVKEIVESCMLHDAEGLPQVRLRETPWGGNCVTFPMNTNPRLFEDTDRPTIAKELLDQVDEMHRRQPSLDGTYVDSLASWGSYLNFRREHFGYAQVPLTFDPDTGRPAIHNRFALLEFLWALRERMHEQGKLVFGNGLRPARRFHCFATDVLGVEGHRFLEQKRVMAYRKPFLLLIYGVSDDPAQMEAHYDLCTLYGIYPWMSCFRQVAELNRRFVPILRTINAAGWEPVTRAESNDPAIWLERWGPDGQGRVYLTAYNSTRQLRPVRLRVEAGRLGLAGERLVAEDILRGWEGEAAMADGVADLDVPALPQRVRVLRLSGE